MKFLSTITVFASLAAGSASAQLIFASADPGDGLSGFANRQLILGYGSGAFFPGWWLGAFDDTGQTANGGQIPADQTRLWSPMSHFTPDTDGMLGTLSAALNTAGLRGLRMEVYELTGTNGSQATSYSLLDVAELDSDSLFNGPGWRDFDFGAEVELSAGVDYYARLSLTEATDKSTWQAAYWMTQGNTYVGVRQSYDSFGTWDDIPIGFGLPGGGYRVVGTPGLAISETTSLGSTGPGNPSVPEPSAVGPLAFLLVAGLLGFGRSRRG